jgi:hypothetical protein
MAKSACLALFRAGGYDSAKPSKEAIVPRVLPLLAVLCLAFAPAPFPKPERTRKTPEIIVFSLKRLAAATLAVEIEKMLAPRGEVRIAFDVPTNALVFSGKKEVIDRVIKAIKEREDTYLHK